MFHMLRQGLMSPMLYSHWFSRSILSLGHPLSTSQMLRLQVGPPRPVRTAVVIEPRTCSMLVSHSDSHCITLRPANVLHCSRWSTLKSSALSLWAFSLGTLTMLDSSANRSSHFCQHPNGYVLYVLINPKAIF